MSLTTCMADFSIQRLVVKVTQSPHHSSHCYHGLSCVTQDPHVHTRTLLSCRIFQGVYGDYHPRSWGQNVTPPLHLHFSSVDQSCLTLCMNRSTSDLPVHHQLLEFTQTQVHRVGEAIQPSHPLSSPSPPAPSPSNWKRVFSNESTLHIKWPKYWSFSFSISPSNEHPGLISLRMDWLDLLAVQGTLKSLLQHHSSKASILQHSAFFTVQLSHPPLTTGNNIDLTDRPLWAK